MNINKQKKLGIVSCYWVRNYGSALQSYATQQIFDELNIPNETIDYFVSRESKFKRIFIILKKLRYKSVRKAKIDQYNKKKKEKSSLEYKNNIKKRYQSFDKFIANNIRFSEPIKNREELLDKSKDYSAILVGSDQLWLPENIEEDFYTLNWVKNGIRRISYSTSFGVSELPNIVKNKARAFLEKLDFIAVREISGAKLIKDLTNKDAQVVLDPTLMLTSNEWDKLAGDFPIFEGDYIFCYFMANGQHKRDYARELQKKTGCKIVVLRHLDEYIEEDEHFGDFAPYEIGPESFVNLIKNAKYVCTDSFHGSVFSILYHKNVFVFNRYKDGVKGSTNTRLASLLTLLGIEDRLVTSEEILPNNINYSAVELKLNKVREDSYFYIKKSIKGLY